MNPAGTCTQYPVWKLLLNPGLSRRLLLRCFAGLLFIVPAVSRVAAQSCIPPAPGVPGHYFEPPNWLGTAPMDSELDDPRWTGALAQTFGIGTGTEAEFRAVYKTDGSGQTTMYLSWYVLYDGALNNNLDRVYVGFQPAAGDPIIVQLVAYGDHSFDLKDQGTGGIQAMTRDPVSGKGVAISPTPTWMNSTRVWLVRGASNSWALQMQVPVNTMNPDLGLNIGATFKMWYTMWVFTPKRIDNSGVASGLVMHTWPRAGADITQDVNTGDNVYPAPSVWDTFHLSTGAGDAFCASEAGISIDVLNIGTTNPDPSEILYSVVNPQPVNTIFAAPKNGMNATIPIGGLTARFRLANWGSVVADPSAPWTNIPNGGAVSNVKAIPPVTQTDATYISFPWTLDNTDIAPYLAGKPVDQCMLVDLIGPGLVFLNTSVRRNMDVVSASKFSREAEINIVGLPPIPGGGPARDVYLGVGTDNMPATVSSPPPTPMISLPGGRLGVAARSLEVKQVPWQTAVATGAVSVDSVAKVVPTYRVHVYHDSGRRLTVDAQKYAILEPQVSFGYFVDHKGALTGWNHGLDGAGLDQIAPDFYKLLVPNNGSAKVTTTVEAVQFKRYAISLLAGVSIPQGNLVSAVDPGFCGTLEFEYGISNSFSAEAVLAYHQFGGKNSAPSVKVTQITLQAKYYFAQIGALRPFANVGAGNYAFSPGTAKVGVNLGVGVLFGLTSNLSLVGAYNFNAITGGNSSSFSSIQVGVRYQF